MSAKTHKEANLTTTRKPARSKTSTAKKPAAKTDTKKTAAATATKTKAPKKAPAKKAPAKKAPAKKAPAKEPAAKRPAAKKSATPAPSKPLLDLILKVLDDDKAEDVVAIDLEGRSIMADAIVIASGRSQRHVSAIVDHLQRRLKDAGYGNRPAEGANQGDWVLLDAGDAIVHVFRPEVRAFYNIEAMWGPESAVEAAV